MQFQKYIRWDLSKYDTNNEVQFAKKSLKKSFVFVSQSNERKKNICKTFVYGEFENKKTKKLQYRKGVFNKVKWNNSKKFKTVVKIQFSFRKVFRQLLNMKNRILFLFSVSNSLNFFKHHLHDRLLYMCVGVRERNCQLQVIQYLTSSDRKKEKKSWLRGGEAIFNDW